MYCRVYPRVCGGTNDRAMIRISLKGLSPRVRGNHVAADSDSARRRSIPACAGEPQDKLDGGEDSKVYPRVCGGTYVDIDIPAFLHGLSPRVRGNPDRRDIQSLRDRSIPACAGEPTSI